ncbi:MAG TPA: serine/threonine-protein kinase [Candidatus Acidoferrum sp.]|nr:serine/threonine-protein kinase [Candidatus Acidoferrum sp.]
MITLQKGRYEALEPLGAGATSRVERARDNVIGRTVALKTFVHGFGEGQEQQFLREAQIIGQLSNPAIVQLYDVGIDEHGTRFLVMEYVAGKTLEHHLNPAALGVQRACAWAADLAGALEIAHRAGIIHGDVKPGNILVTQEFKVKLGDFGIARFATQVSGSGRLMGTPAYLAPEQIQGEPLNPRSDQFALGIVLYQMVTGVRPFAGTSLGAVCAQILNAEPVPPSRHNPAVPEALDRVIARCLEKNPRDRFASCEDLARSLYPLARARVDARAPALPPKTKKRSWWSKPSGQRDVWIVAAACLLLAACVPVSRDLRARFANIPAPSTQAPLPSVPRFAFASTSQMVAEASQTEVLIDLAPPAEPEHPAPRRSNKAKPAPVKLKRPSNPLSTSLNASLDSVPPKPSADKPAVPAVPTIGLHIEISSTINEGTVAIFADRELLFSMDLQADKSSQPLRFERALPVGSHQFRVALYKPNRSLQLEKEGLAEINSDGQNSLAVRVNRRTKMLVRKELAMEVTWPGSTASSLAHNSTLTTASAAVK